MDTESLLLGLEHQDIKPQLRGIEQQHLKSLGPVWTSSSPIETLSTLDSLGQLEPLSRLGSQRQSPEPLKQLSLKQSASDKPIYGLNDIPATEYASFQSPVLFYQQLGKVLEDVEQLKTGLLDLQKLGVSKQDSL